MAAQFRPLASDRQDAVEIGEAEANPALGRVSPPEGTVVTAATVIAG